MERNKVKLGTTNVKKGNVLIGNTIGNNANLSYNNLNNMKRSIETNIESQVNNKNEGSGQMIIGTVNSSGDGANLGFINTQNQNINKNDDLESKIRERRLKREDLARNLVKELDENISIQVSLVKILSDVQKHVKGELGGDWDKSVDLITKIYELKDLAQKKLGKKISSSKIREVCWAQAEEEELKKNIKIIEQKENEVEELGIGEARQELLPK